MKLNILHISDLHRDLENPISNDALLNSLLQDITIGASEEPSIPIPQLIIVSGDLIQGTTKDKPDAANVLNSQYEQANNFLSRLCDELVAGDRQKVVIVPGNHDVSFPSMFSALQEIEYTGASDQEKSELAALIWSEQSKYRWSWSDFKLYKIVDQAKYDQRLDEFAQFYNNFYQGTRQYSSDALEQFDTFDYPDWNLVITGLNSCFLNDPWNRVGIIHPQAFANACEQLRDRRFRGRLRLAVWHHSTKGAPRQDDYMDSDFLQQLVTHGYSLGFHGHQHKPEMMDEKFAFGGQRKVNALSASTLAGGEMALSPGGTRGYNRVILDMENWLVELHVRQMVNPDFLAPIWGKGFLPSGNSFEQFPLQKPRSIDPTTITTQDLPECMMLIEEKQYHDAIQILEPLAERNETAKRLLLDALVGADDKSGLIRHFSKPISPEEIVAVANAMWEESDLDNLRSLLALPAVTEHLDASVVHIREKLSARLI